MRLDKKREVLNGHDGTWVAHPALVETAMNVFNTHMPQANQINRKRAMCTFTETLSLAMQNLGPREFENAAHTLEDKGNERRTTSQSSGTQQDDPILLEDDPPDETTTPAERDSQNTGQEREEQAHKKA